MDHLPSDGAYYYYLIFNAKIGI